MIARRVAAAVAFGWAMVAIAVVVGQERPAAKRTLTSGQRTESIELVRMVDRVAGGELPGGDAFLSWTPHFFKGPDGKTYVPFSVRLEDALEGFDSIGMYVRVVAVAPDPAPTSGPRRVDDFADANPGDIPISVPERQFVGRRAPSAGENAAILAATEAYLTRRSTEHPFEDLYFVKPQGAARGEVRTIRRAVAVPAGQYQVYLAIRESFDGRSPAAPRKGAVLKQTVTVPDYSKPDLALSSIVLADRIEALGKPVSAGEQAERPYALGTAEIQPASDSKLRPDEILSLIFLVYNPMVDGAGKPDVMVSYRFYQSPFETFYIATEPQVFDAETLPANFDLKAAGNALVVDAAIPMTRFSPGSYRLTIEATDRRAGKAVTGSLQFIVAPESGTADPPE